MRNLRLNHEEIELITMALQFAFDQKLKIVEQNRKVLGEDQSKAIVESANKYLDLQFKINDGEKDV